MEAVKIEQEEGNKLTKFQEEALKDAEKELETMKKEMSARKYLIDLKKEDIKLVNDFINVDAKWKFTECLGIVEVTKELESCVKSGKLFTTAVAIEAIYYYMSKVEGSGNTTDTQTFKTLSDYLRILKQITNGVERIKADGEKIRAAEFIVAARREGIEPEASIIDQKDEKN